MGVAARGCKCGACEGEGLMDLCGSDHHVPLERRGDRDLRGGGDLESDEDDIRTFDVNEKDSLGNSPLLLTCRSGNFEMSEMLVVAGAGVSATNKRNDTPLLAAVGAVAVLHHPPLPSSHLILYI